MTGIVDWAAARARMVIAFVVMITVLLVRPQGLMGKA